MTDKLIEGILKKDKRAIAKGITLVENESPRSIELLKSLYKYTGNAFIVGITGPPGAGKSTLTNCLTKYFREINYEIGIIAVDPTSPFTGGALLGDRIRMQEIGLDDGVIIRSMATRGSLGGLSNKTKEACEIMDASGKDFIFLETVGVGQSELDVAQTADITIIVLVPEFGDAVQTMKAGLMEIGDIFVINKSDRPGADTLVIALKTMLQLKLKKTEAREIRVIKTVGTANQGIEEVANEIIDYKNYLLQNGFLKEKRKVILEKQINELVNDRLENKFWDEQRQNLLNQNLQSILDRNDNPYSFVDRFFEK